MSQRNRHFGIGFLAILLAVILCLQMTYNGNFVVLVSETDDFKDIDDNTHQLVNGVSVDSEGHRAERPRHHFKYRSGSHNQDQEDNIFPLKRNNVRTSYVSAELDPKDGFPVDNESDDDNSEIQECSIVSNQIFYASSLRLFSRQAIYYSTAHARDGEIAAAAAQRKAADNDDARYIADFDDSYRAYAKVLPPRRPSKPHRNTLTANCPRQAQKDATAAAERRQRAVLTASRAYDAADDAAWDAHYNAYVEVSPPPSPAAATARAVA